MCLICVKTHILHIVLLVYLKYLYHFHSHAVSRTVDVCVEVLNIHNSYVDEWLTIIFGWMMISERTKRFLSDVWHFSSFTFQSKTDHQLFFSLLFHSHFPFNTFAANVSCTLLLATCFCAKLNISFLLQYNPTTTKELLLKKVKDID